FVTSRIKLSRLAASQKSLASLLFGNLVVAAIYLLLNVVGVTGICSQVALWGVVAIALFVKRECLKECWQNIELRFALFVQLSFFLTIIFTASLVSGVDYVSPVSL